MAASLMKASLPRVTSSLASIVSVFVLAMTMPGVGEAAKEQFVEPAQYKVAQGDPTVQGDPFPPWDLSPAPSGFSTEIFNAVCEANKVMDCEVVARPYADCIASDGVPGPALLDDEIVACLTWSPTDPRLLNGLTPTSVYSQGGAGAQILSDDTQQGNTLVIVEGFLFDDACASDNGFDYGDLLVVDTIEDAIAAIDADTDAIVPAGFPAGSNEVLGEFGCSFEIAAMTYPPALFVETHDFIENFNCGLQLIAANGTYQSICDLHDAGGFSVPLCLDPASFGEPSKSCKRLEDKSAGNQ